MDFVIFSRHNKYITLTFQTINRFLFLVIQNIRLIFKDLVQMYQYIVVKKHVSDNKDQPLHNKVATEYAHFKYVVIRSSNVKLNMVIAE